MAKELVPNAKYFVWEMGIRDRTKPVRQVNRKLLTLEEAKSLARIGAQEGKHDREVTTNPKKRQGFEVMAHYEAGTGKNVTQQLRTNGLPAGKATRRTRVSIEQVETVRAPHPAREERAYSAGWRYDPETGAPLKRSAPAPEQIYEDEDGSPLEEWADD